MNGSLFLRFPLFLILNFLSLTVDFSRFSFFFDSIT